MVWAWRFIVHSDHINSEHFSVFLFIIRGEMQETQRFCHPSKRWQLAQCFHVMERALVQPHFMHAFNNILGNLVLYGCSFFLFLFLFLSIPPQFRFSKICIRKMQTTCEHGEIELKVVVFAKGQNQQGRKSSPNKKLVHDFLCAIPQCIREKERLVVFWCKWVFNVIMIVDKCTIPMLVFPCIWTQRYFQKHPYKTNEPMCKTRNVLRGISLTVSKKWIPF